MEHTLINTIISSIIAAFILGLLAKKLKMPAILGYLLAGIAIGPHTPGFIGDVGLAKQLAEIGIILLMFGVGLHFSFRDLLESRKIALPGALVQMASATIIGASLAFMLGHGVVSAIIFGFSLSVASTIVLIRSLEQRSLLTSSGGKIAISWLIIEDIAMVFALVMIPVVAEIMNGTQDADSLQIIGIFCRIFFKIALFFAFMFYVARRFLPWLLAHTVKIRSEELNTIGTLAIAFGCASLSYIIFDASLALGAFLAGVMLNESEIGRKSAKNSVQLRDAFSVLFFVSVGMLFDPYTLVTQPIPVFLTFLTIVLAKSVAALIITRLFKQTLEVSYAVALGLAQIGEFSFILGGVGLAKGLLTQELYNLILAGAMLSIVVNPFLFRIYDLLVVKSREEGLGNRNS
ncbi:MAG: cation:proton antiporter [Pseudomonadota bacterium]